MTTIIKKISEMSQNDILDFIKPKEWIRPMTVLNNGVKISIQVSKYHYCEPREDGLNLSEYTSVELKSSEPLLINDERLKPYLEEDSHIFAFVPISLVKTIISECDGVDMESTFKGYQNA